jgi:hypothetical protein
MSVIHYSRYFHGGGHVKDFNIHEATHHEQCIEISKIEGVQ